MTSTETVTLQSRDIAFAVKDRDIALAIADQGITTTAATVNGFLQMANGCLLLMENGCRIIINDSTITAKLVTLTDRDITFTLDNSDTPITASESISLKDRDITFTLKDRDITFTTISRGEGE